MRTHTRRLIAVVLVTIGLLAGTTSPAGATDQWSNRYFNDQWPSDVCVWGINAVEHITGGLRFRSLTRSFTGDCATHRSLSPGYIESDVGVEVLNWTTGARYLCNYIDLGTNSGIHWQVDTGYTNMTNAQMRSLCGIPATHSATAGAQSRHSAVIWGTWEQTGVFVGDAHAASI
jgi:hypothetical protein